MSWGDVFNASLQTLWWGFVQFAPKLILAIVFFVIGWALGSVIAKAFEQVFKALKIDSLLHSISLDDFLRKAGMNLNSGYFVGQVIKWFVILIFLLPSLNLLGLDDVAYFLKDDVLGFLPKIIVAALILVIATFVSDFLSRTVKAGAKAMSLKSAHMLGSLVKYVIWVFAFIIALGQLGVAEAYMGTLFMGLVGMIALGGALAFGLGGKEAAGRFISRLGEEMAHRE